MGAIGDNDTKDFALSILLAEADLEIKFEIVNCINNNDYHLATQLCERFDLNVA